MDSIATLTPAHAPGDDCAQDVAGVTMTIVGHPDPGRVGETAAVEFDARQRVPLSRREPLFAAAGQPGRPLEDPHLSRSPIYLSFKAGEMPVWTDPAHAPSEIRPLHGAQGRAWYVGLRRRVGLLIELGLRAAPPREQHGLVGVSAATARLREQIEATAGSELPVLLSGETGTGKELAAQAIHALGRRRQQPLVAVNLSAIPDSTAASQLFGHARGAFTDAARAHDGYFLQADGGTLFLDEIGDASIGLQVQLLRALEQREIQPVGGRVRAVDVRLITATDADLDDAVAAGRFRKALLFRLCGQTLKLLPLRDRPADIAVQLVHFLDRALDGLGRREHLRLRSWTDSPWLDLEAVEAALNARWPGNSRELRAVASQAALLGANQPKIVLATSSPPAPASASRSTSAVANAAAEEPARALTESAIRATLAAHQHSVRGAARALQVAPNTLYARMRELGIPLAGALSDEELAAAHEASGGNVTMMARALGVSLRGIQRRLGRAR
ncbi:sigma 54-interacting transcriptional regulator [Nannocystis punicea]|uniref:Sigma 54-interacting transcriptional regulator n=1 Tax=Nannocystis punicea TaxID=2995304 RepID=A0ABY7H9T7_9BACT|nr:sigma 54-interacting transcriptional regulator [Nannocystis poenicansa]WAS95754.1 sigma 54-interacting transcriptional regulator [Nannocystis poenicansa]